MRLFIDKKVLPFLQRLNPEIKVKVGEYIELFEENGFSLFPPHMKKISGHNLWELRPKNIRLLIGKITHGAIVVVGFYKTSNKTSIKHIKLALNRLKLWQ